MVTLPFENLDTEGGMEAMLGDVIVDTEEEYRDFVQKNDLPDGYVFSRTPFGTPPGSWKVVVKQKPNIQRKDTNLENQLRCHLESWEYLRHFEHDYRVNGRQVDFADPHRKIALEPGAVYWHTPDTVKGDTKSEVGEHPEEVYIPAKETDIQKQKTLSDDGWRIIWITEDGVENEPNLIKSRLEGIY